MSDEYSRPSEEDLPTEGFPPGEGPAPPEVAGYSILRRIASGGMGDVYDAEQKEPIRRRVALKVIKWGMDTREVVARFESERQALALMDHPNVARIYDAGATDAGRPYFAMEFIKGVAISDYCDGAYLTTPERLALFIAVCEGVQHAHQKGIIHRDLKPSNVLVELQDGRAVPKIIDFGVAKATGQRLTEQTLYTAHGQFIGTAEYMSPEQAELTGLDVDTRTDVYSLGVLLYELLVGALPFDSKELRQGGYDEARRRIREEEPPRPSTRITSQGDTSTVTARNRRTDVQTLTRELRGDLDWIVLKAIEKDRNRRYSSVTELAADIGRYLANQPVLASPPSTLYRMKKFVQRHKFGVSAAALVGIALLLGMVGTGLSLVRALEAERLASREAETARQVSDFLVRLFEVSDPDEAEGETITAREILDQGAERIERELEAQPLTQARLMATIGTVYQELGLYDSAAPLLERSLARREELLAVDDPEVADSLARLVVMQRRQGKYEEAKPRAERALAIREQALGPDSLETAASLTSLGWVHAMQGEHAEALTRFERAHEIRQQQVEAEDPLVAESLNDLGITFWRLSRFDEAESHLNRALAIFEERLGPDSARARRVLGDLAILYWSEGKYAESEAMQKRSMEIEERVLGPDHPALASSYNNLAVLYDSQGRYEEAEALLERALEIQLQVYGPGSDDVGMGKANLAWVYYQQGKYEAAEPLYVEALAIYERGVGPDHPSVATLLRDWALLYLAQGHYAEAERLLQRSLSIREQSYGAEHPEVAQSVAALADVYRDEGRLEEAEPLYQRALAIREAKLGGEHPLVAETLEAYLELLRRAGREGEAGEVASRLEQLR
ncbi:MAG: serine/threonine protein kinase [Acidobacteria bacterium]|nr:MAG: serine/threonine protein kinase [Acidobacteriota bacterium]